MNAMPMMYAKAYRTRGKNVLYFVDVPRSEGLSRPETHFPDITYPYPDWIVERKLSTQLLAAIFPRAVKHFFLRKASRLARTEPDAVFLGGYFVALAPYFPKRTKKIFLSYGSDLERWVDSERSNELYEAVRSTSVFRYLPKVFGRRLLRKIVERNEAGARSCDDVLFFPRGMSARGDAVVDKLAEHGVRYTPRYDISFDVFRGVSRTLKAPAGKLVVISPVRFFYAGIPSEFALHYKGNDLIIQGLAQFRVESHADMEIHFFEKGPHVENAKALCDELGLTDIVKWHKPVSLPELLSMYEKADVIFDQVGTHWIGAVGMYALYMGKPLIANVSNLAFLGDIPALNASDTQGVVQALHVVQSRVGLHDLHARAKAFSETKVGPERVIGKLDI